MGLALRPGARRIDARKPGRCASPSTAGSAGASGNGSSSLGIGANLSRARVLQVRGLLPHQRPQRSAPGSGSTFPCRWPLSCSLSPSRSSRSRAISLLHRHPPGRRPGRPRPRWTFAVYLFFFPHLVAGPIVRAESSPAGGAPLTHAVDPAGRVPDRGGPFKKVVIANYLAPGSSTRSSQRRGGTRRSRSSFAIWPTRADLLRLQRLHRHGHRPRSSAGLPLPAELRLALLAASLQGLLAALAHDASAGCATISSFLSRTATPSAPRAASPTASASAPTGACS